MSNKKLSIQYIPPSELKPNPQNPRQNEHVIEPLVQSFERYGFLDPIIARQEDNIIIAGHTRWKAALKKGMKDVPVVFVDLPERESLEYNIASNKLGELASWDNEQLVGILKELDEMDSDLLVLGFSEEEINNLLDDATRKIEPSNEEEQIKKAKEVECPNCGHVFTL